VDAHNCSPLDGGEVDASLGHFYLPLPGPQPAGGATGEWSPCHDEYMVSATCNETMSYVHNPKKFQPVSGTSIMKLYRYKNSGLKL